MYQGGAHRAESFGFGTAPMVALGCKYLRICHLNNCATGVATQHNVAAHQVLHRPARHGDHYFKFVAQECREIMGVHGVRSLSELIGHTELLKILPGETSKAAQARFVAGAGEFRAGVEQSPNTASDPHNEPFDKGVLGEKMLTDMRDAIANKSGGKFSYAVRQFPPLHRCAHFRGNRKRLG